MPISIAVPEEPQGLHPRLLVIGVGGAGGNAVNNMIRANLPGVEFMIANTDAQAMNLSLSDLRIQLGATVTKGLGAGAKPDIGRQAAEEQMDEILDAIRDANMVFIAAGMGGGTGTGAAPVIARAARDLGILTVGVVTKPFQFEGAHRMRLADSGIEEMAKHVDTLIVVPNQNLFRIANERTTFAEAFKMADNVLHAGVRGITDLMVRPGLVNTDFADVRTVMSAKGKAMMGTGEAYGDRRAIEAAEAAIANPLLDDMTLKGATAVLVNITAGMDMTLFEIDEAVDRIRAEVHPDANIIFGSTLDEEMDGRMRVSVVATGIAQPIDLREPAPATQTTQAHAAAPAQSAAPAPVSAPLSPQARIPTPTVRSIPVAPAAAMQPSVQTAQPAAAQVQQPAAIAAQSTQPQTTGQATSGQATSGMGLGLMGTHQPAATQAQMQPQMAQQPSFHGNAALKPAEQEFPFDEPTTAAERGALAQGLRAPAQGGFIPAPSIDPGRTPTIAAPGPQATGGRRPSLFERVTGALRPGQTAAPAAAAPAVAAQPQRPAQPALRVEAGGLPKTAEDDLLDIPAFLRRQAN